MITKIQNTPNQPTFTAKWSDARKIIVNLPESHAFFKGLNYTRDNKILCSKQVVIARLDKFADVVNNRGVKRRTFNLDMPDFSNIYKSPKKFFRGLAEQYLLGSSVNPHYSHTPYYFERKTIKYQHGVKIIKIKHADSVGDVANFLLARGKSLAKALKNAGLKNPKEIEV